MVAVSVLLGGGGGVALIKELQLGSALSLRS